MFYHLLYPLKEFWFGFNVFKYITFRAAAAAITAFLLSVIIGPYIIRKLKEFKIGQTVYREDAPDLYKHHKQKEGTPTMGGVIIVGSLIISTLLWGNLTNIYLLLAVFSTILLAAVGFKDDYLKLIYKNSKGLPAKKKFFGQVVVGLVIGIYVVFFNPDIPTKLDIPFFKDKALELGIFYVFFVMVVIIGSSNAVNLTDGLDGLAVGCTTMVALTYSLMSYLAGNINFSNYLNIFYIPGSGELTVFCAALVGSSLGFLWFNSYPATVFMGDTGSLAIGGAIGVVAVFIRKELLLLLVGGIFVAEALSVILQVASFKIRKKRIFLMAPLHHHFQLKGWPESKITVRFLIVASILALASLATLKLR